MDRRALATVALAACLLTACTGDPEPKVADPSPTPTVSSSSPSASPSVTGAVDPETPYREFIEAYVGAISTSLSTGDPGPWLAMSDPACENCPVFAQNVRDAYADGGHIQGASWSITSADFEERNEVGDIWYVEVENKRERWLDGNGDLVKVIEPSTNYFAFAIVGDGRDLRLRELRYREP